VTLEAQIVDLLEVLGSSAFARRSMAELVDGHAVLAVERDEGQVRFLRQPATVIPRHVGHQRQIVV